MDKIYGTINVKEVRARGVNGCEQHNRRQYEQGKMPENIDPSRTHLNIEEIADGKANFNEALGEKLNGLTVRKNAVNALEYVLGASPEFFKKANCTPYDYLMKAASFVAEKHGDENIVAINMHFDEKTPHVHLLVTPIVEKEVRWKNKKKEGVKKERRLCARDFTGHPNMLRKLQKDFYEHIVPIGQEVGVEFARYTSAQEQVKVYSKRVDYRIDEINRIYEQTLEQNITLTRQLELNKQILIHKEEMDKEIKAKRKAEQRITTNKKINKDKGNGGGPRIKM